MLSKVDERSLKIILKIFWVFQDCSNENSFCQSAILALLWQAPKHEKERVTSYTTSTRSIVLCGQKFGQSHFSDFKHFNTRGHDLLFLRAVHISTTYRSRAIRMYSLCPVILNVQFTLLTESQ